MSERFSLELAEWRSRWREALEACSRLGGEARPLAVAPSADSAAVDAIEGTDWRCFTRCFQARPCGVLGGGGFQLVSTRWP